MRAAQWLRERSMTKLTQSRAAGRARMNEMINQGALRRTLLATTALGAMTLEGDSFSELVLK